jgi:hypothetical protein
LETYATSSTVKLEGGAEMRLGSSSRGRVYKDRLVLESGEGQVTNAGGYHLVAGGLRIFPGSSSARTHVAVRPTGHVTVSALAGSLTVSTAEGTLLARLEPGRALEFETQAAGAAPPFSVEGCVSAVESRFLLTDRTAGVSFELRGPGLAQYAGQHVQIAATDLKGVRPGPGASQVIQVSSVKRTAGSCAVPAAGAKKPAGGSGGKKAVIAGVAIAAAAGGVTLGLTGDEPARPPISR